MIGRGAGKRIAPMVRGRRVAVISLDPWKMADFAMYNVSKGGGLGLLLELDGHGNSMSNVQAAVDAVQRFGAQAVVGIGANPGVMDIARATALLSTNPDAKDRLRGVCHAPAFESLPFCAMPILPTGNECSKHAWVVSEGQTRLDLGTPHPGSLDMAIADPGAIASKLGTRGINAMALSCAGVVVQAAEQATASTASPAQRRTALEALAGAGAAITGLLQSQSPSSACITECLDAGFHASFLSSTLKDTLQGGIAAAIVGGATTRYALDPMHLAVLAGPHTAEMAVELLEDDESGLEAWGAVAECLQALQRTSPTASCATERAKAALEAALSATENPVAKAEDAATAMQTLFQGLDYSHEWDFSPMDIDNIVTGAEAEPALASLTGAYASRSRLKDLVEDITATGRT
jgi:alcohol dehydrogenase class IV